MIIGIIIKIIYFPRHRGDGMENYQIFDNLFYNLSHLDLELYNIPFKLNLALIVIFSVLHLHIFIIITL
jgi:hypothetical protein